MAPVAAGGLVAVTGLSVFDPLIAVGIGLWLMSTTLRELRQATHELLWPEDATCPHGEHAAA
jgi:divalent metal cation (Fe/Co/Zn/Cd) transporter